MKINKLLCTLSDCYKTNRKISPNGLIIHSVGCPQPDPFVFQRIWNKPGVNVCVHGVVGTDGSVVQCLEWNHRGWHAGGLANNTHIGIEMTEPASIKYTRGSSWIDLDQVKTRAHVLATYRHAVELFAYLCKKYSLDPLKNGVILSHSEAHRKGLASNHGDVEHLWSRFGLTMNGFRRDVKKAMEPVIVKPVEVVSKPVVKNQTSVTISKTVYGYKTASDALKDKNRVKVVPRGTYPIMIKHRSGAWNIGKGNLYWINPKKL